MKTSNKETHALKSYLGMLLGSGVNEIILPPVQPAANEKMEGSPAAIATQSALEQNAQPGRREALLELRKVVQGCTKCGELAGARTQTVFGAGYVKAKLVFVGEAPGFDEDKQGLPFVGKAGQLLTKMIEAIGMKREEVFICNVLKCRPPQNRNPKPEEVINCSPYLWAQLNLIQPKIICALGNFAAQALLQTTKSISHLRGVIHDANGFQIICTFHPAYLLRNPEDKRKAWEDLKRVKQEVDRPNSVEN